ncbi:MAG TPA: hypothetical protein DIT01_14855 [Lentisphaeria bacterium]|mgnify:CR=1 FL=1|nr:hypothetical protein [Lentisphaeria bacterium]
MFSKFTVFTPIFVALVLVTHISRGQAGADMAGAEAKAEGWKLQFSDDFSRTELGENWNDVRGNWTIKNRMLTADSSAHIVSNWRFTGDVRLEYEAITDSENPCDLSGVLSAQFGKESSGYYFGLGGQNNKESFLIARAAVVKRANTRIVPGKRYQVVCQREGKNITFTVDGKVIISYVHDKPIDKPGFDRVGMSVYAPGRFDNVRIFTKNDGKAIPPSRSEQAVQSYEVTGFEIEDPLFEELFSDAPAQDIFPTYGTIYGIGRGGAAIDYAERTQRKYRATAKRFGMRFVVDETLDEAAKYNLVVYGNMSDPEFARRGIRTQSRVIEPPNGLPLISLPDDSLPYVYGTRGWFFDPRFLDYMASEIEQRAKDGEQWGIPQFDEIFSYYAIKPVPKDKWYKEVHEAEKEIREQYGFGKFGMPETHQDGDPFRRIAHRRWASDKLTEAFAKAYKAAKAVNPDMKLLGPTHGSNATSADMEAWAPYFDILGGQVSGGSSPALLDWVRPGCNTKLYADLTGKPIWMMVHLSKDHAKVTDPEFIREMYSQVFRSGGQGLWLMNTEFFERELEDARFAEPAKWRAVLELSQMISKMKLPKLPEPDCAILYASDSTNTTLYGGFSYHNHQDVNAYAVVGPCLRSWPQFVTDRQIDRGDRDLGDYKILYIPYAPYQRAEVLEKVKSYVRGGGTVVCTDSDAFTWNINGEKFGAQWDELTGVRKTGTRDGAAIMTTVTPNSLNAVPLELGALASGSQIELLNEKVIAIAVFDDGSPAITLHNYGKGKVIYFAADPFYVVGDGKARRSTVAQGAPIVQFIEAIQKVAGVKMGHDIWRFTLPPFNTDVYQKETDKCLTNNYIYDANDPLLEPDNVESGGTYTYSRAPSTFTDTGKTGEAIPFASGHLTNRLAAFETRNRRGSRPRDPKELDKITAQWIVGWDDPAPITITFDLKSDQPLSFCRLVYSGTMPMLAVKGSKDGNEWLPLAKSPEQVAGEDVKDVRLTLNKAGGKPGEYRHVLFDFAARKAGDTFELCEIEIWGAPAGAPAP